MKKFLLALTLIAIVGCGATQQSNFSPYKNMIAIIQTNHGDITIDFYEQEAPELTKNFIELAKTGYYDGLTFHRIIKGFMIQGGDPAGNGTGGQSYIGTGLADEPGALKLKHIRGAVSWAKSSRPNSIGSQFFIVHQPSHFLDGSYSVFAQVLEGMEVVDTIATLETDPGDMPLEEAKIHKVTLKKKGE